MRLLSTASAIAIGATGILIGGPATAQQANTTPANVNVLNLLSPYLSLNATPVGQATLSANLAQAVALNQGASVARQQLAISDKTLPGSPTTITLANGSTLAIGPADNLAGGLPLQAVQSAGGLAPLQPVGGLGTQLGAIYQTGIRASTATTGPLAATYSLLTSAYSFTSCGPRRRQELLRQRRRHQPEHHAGELRARAGRGARRLHAADLQRPAQHDQQRLRHRLRRHQQGRRPGRLRLLAPDPGGADAVQHLRSDGAQRARHQPLVPERAHQLRLHRRRAAGDAGAEPVPEHARARLRVRREPHRARRALPARHHRLARLLGLRPGAGLHQPALHEQRGRHRHGDQPADAVHRGAEQPARLSLGAVRRRRRDLLDERGQHRRQSLRALGGQPGALPGAPDLRPADADLRPGPARGRAGRRPRRLDPAGPDLRRQHDGGPGDRAQRRHARQPGDEHDQPDHRQHRGAGVLGLLRHAAELLEPHRPLLGRRLLRQRDRRAGAGRRRTG